MGRGSKKIIGRLFTSVPELARKSAAKVEKLPDWVDLSVMPWARLDKPLSECTIAIVTTAGLHLPNQTPFNMEDPDGDPSFRELPSDTAPDGYAITHDYYDHSDAELDINVVFPVERLREMAEEGLVGGVAPVNYGFMGHITGSHLKTLINETAPEVAERLKQELVDAVLLTPG